MTYKIGFAGTDGRTLLSAYTVSTARSDRYPGDFSGVVVRGMPGMQAYAEAENWPIEFIPTTDNSPESYAQALIAAFREDRLDAVVPMPEALLFEGLVNQLMAVGLGERVVGFTLAGAFIEANKIACKDFCFTEIPTAMWVQADARDYRFIRNICLGFCEQFGGAVLKYPYSAGGKGARMILSPWDIREVYDTLMRDYSGAYQSFHGSAKWPLLIEARMSGVEISFTVFIDGNGHYQIFPTALDYPERFPGPQGKMNPVTGGMASISPHPLESSELIEMAGESIVEPLIHQMKLRGILRPCIIYPGCIVNFSPRMKPQRLRVCEINIRPGEPEWQVVLRRVRNLGSLVKAMLDGNLDEVKPEVRDDQIAMTAALVVGPGGPDGQKGYPWSCTKGERLVFDNEYLKKKKIFLLPAGVDCKNGEYFSDGTRIVYLLGNAQFGSGKSRDEAARELRDKLLRAYSEGKVRVIPREDPDGNRLQLREDVGLHYGLATSLFANS